MAVPGSVIVVETLIKALPVGSPVGVQLPAVAHWPSAEVPVHVELKTIVCPETAEAKLVATKKRMLLNKSFISRVSY